MTNPSLFVFFFLSIICSPNNQGTICACVFQEGVVNLVVNFRAIPNNLKSESFIFESHNGK